MIAIQKHLVKIAVLLNIYGPYEYERGVQLCLKMSPQIRGPDANKANRFILHEDTHAY